MTEKQLAFLKEQVKSKIPVPAGYTEFCNTFGGVEDLGISFKEYSSEHWNMWLSLDIQYGGAGSIGFGK